MSLDTDHNVSIYSRYTECIICVMFFYWRPTQIIPPVLSPTHNDESTDTVQTSLFNSSLPSLNQDATYFLAKMAAQLHYINQQLPILCSMKNSKEGGEDHTTFTWWFHVMNTSEFNFQSFSLCFLVLTCSYFQLCQF